MKSKVIEQAKKEVQEYYRKTWERGVWDWQKLDFGAEISQQIRYKVAFQNLDLRRAEAFSLLDVGCGVGDFYGFLEQNCQTDFKYLGVDICPFMIARAKEKYPGGDFVAIESLEGVNGSFDFAVALCVFVIGRKGRQVEFMKATLRELYGIVKDAVAFTCLSRWREKKRQMETDFGLEEIYRICKSCGFQRVAVDYSYAPHDFLVVCKKGDSEWMKKWKRVGGW